MEVAELLDRLESNQPEIVEESKKKFREIFLNTKESWLVNGLCDYYLSTSSSRSVEILVGVREPHDRHLFDRLSDSLKGSSKLQTLTLLGHIVRRHPAWLHKIAHHSLLKELLKLLKVETDILPLMTALLVLIVLLPMIPDLIGGYLQDIFEVFSRLAAWNTNNPNKLPEEHLLHLQVGLYTLFHRLYGMYPCNFLSYLRHEYGQIENLGIFSHTIKPMLDTVKMHPLLVTASKDAETATSRWMKMEHHDVILECAKFASLDTLERPREEVSHQGLPPTSRKRYSLEHSSLESAYQHQIKGNPSLNPTSSQVTQKEDWSPSIFCGMDTPPPQEVVPTSIPQTPNSQEGTSPPEAAIEATPETTPIKDMRHLGRHPPVNSSVARALTSFSSSKWAGVTSGSSTPAQSQPSSPMKKEPSPFRFPPEGSNSSKSAFEQPQRDSMPSAFERRDSLFSQKIQRIQQDRIQVIDSLALNVRSKMSGVPPTSPLRSIANEISIPNSPVHMEPTAPVPGGKEWLVAKPVPEKNGFRFDSAETSGTVSSHLDSSQEDQEVLEIVRQGEQWSIDTQPKQSSVLPSSQRQCDSVLEEFHPPHMDDYEECEQESGSPCTSGGLHMPTSRSMREFAHRVHQQHRQRCYSQCTTDTERSYLAGFSTGSSPGEGSAALLHSRVQRANSCPDMKRGPVLPGAEANIGRTLEEKEELEDLEGALSNLDVNEQPHTTNGREEENDQLSQEFASVTFMKQMATASTQTVDHWSPLPYEHLFLGAFPPVEHAQTHNGEMKASTAPSPAPLCHHTELFPRYSPYAMLDKYIETVIQGHGKDDRDTKKANVQGLESELKTVKEQLTLLNIQLQFERHRREAHAERNRRLLGKSRSNRALEEHNSALRDQLSLLQKDIENLYNEREKKKKEVQITEQQLQETINYWQSQCNTHQKDIKELRRKNELLEHELKQAKEKATTNMKELQQVKSVFFEVTNEMQHAVAEASAGQQLRSNLEELQKELILMGELQQKYRDRFSQLPLLRHYEEEQAHLHHSYREELKGVNEMLESRNSLLEAAKARIIELDSVVTRRDMIIADQKRILKQVKEEYQKKLEAVESKCDTHRAIRQRMESHVLELYHQLDIAEKTSKVKGSRSPDSSAAHEVSVISAGSADKPSFSPHSSPLSESLGSAEGSLSGILSGKDVGMKNLQVIVDQPEQPSADQQQPVTSQQSASMDIAAADNSIPEEEG
ncbi:hamartin isoform X2 [Cryptotermes secundus]|nr:hamartin isoform X2 [Cryptotermes secundus]